MKTLEAQNTAFKENIRNKKNVITTQVAGMSGHHNWKANRVLWGLEDQLHWFRGAASEIPLRICCRK